MAEQFNSSNTILSSTSITDVYQAPNVASLNRAVVLSCLIANKKTVASGSVVVSMVVTDSTNVVQSTVLSLVPVPNSSTLEAVPNKLILRQGQKLRVTAGEASQLDVTVSTLEIT